jgi:hypothetical protein
MAIETYNLTFTKDLADRPVLQNIGKRYALTCNLKKAQLSDGAGWVQVALSGDMDEIQRAVADLMTQGVLVSPPHLNVLTTDVNPMP